MDAHVDTFILGGVGGMKRTGRSGKQQQLLLSVQRILAVWALWLHARVRLWGASPKTDSLVFFRGQELSAVCSWPGWVWGWWAVLRPLEPTLCEGCHPAACPGNTCFLFLPVDMSSVPVPCENGVVDQTQHSLWCQECTGGPVAEEGRASSAPEQDVRFVGPPTRPSVTGSPQASLVVRLKFLSRVRFKQPKKEGPSS